MKRFTAVAILLVMLCSVFASSPVLSAGEPKTAEPERVGEELELRTKNSETYRLSDGTYECVVFAEDKYYETETGSLVEIDNSVIASDHVFGGKEYGFTNAANSTHVYFSDNKPSVMISAEKGSVSFEIETDHGVNPSVGGLKDTESISGYLLSGECFISYPEVFENADLVYEVKNGLLKEYIVLNDASAPKEFTFSFDTEGYDIAYTENGTVGFYDGNGELVFELGDLFAVDSADAYTDELTYTIGEIVEGNADITVSLSEDYVNDPERAFPILIDPSVMISGADNIQDSFVSSKNPTSKYYTSNYIRMGWDSNYFIRRTYIRFVLPSSIQPWSITESYLSLKKQNSGNEPSLKAYRVTGSWAASAITWNNAPGYSTTYASNTAEARTNNWYRFYVTDIVKKWYSGTFTNYGFMVKDLSESGTGNWSTFYSSDADSPNKPELRIKYSDYYTITFNGNGNTFGTAPEAAHINVGDSLVLPGKNQMAKAGSCSFLGWCTTSSGSGITYSANQQITPSANMTLYAKWGTPVYSHENVTMKVWVDYTFVDAQGDAWSSKIDDYVAAASLPFYQTFNISFLPSSPCAIQTPKSLCSYAPYGCQHNINASCDTHHTNANKLLEYISNNGSSIYGLNTLLYYGETTCYNGIHEKGVGGLAYLPGTAPGVQASMVQCLTFSSTIDWGTVRRIQHEWSHNFGARHSGADGTNCTGMCINNKSFDDGYFYPVADVWCSRCKAAMAAHLGDY